MWLTTTQTTRNVSPPSVTLTTENQVIAMIRVGKTHLNWLNSQRTLRFTGGFIFI